MSIECYFQELQQNRVGVSWGIEVARDSNLSNWLYSSFATILSLLDTLIGVQMMKLGHTVDIRIAG